MLQALESSKSKPLIRIDGQNDERKFSLKTHVKGMLCQKNVGTFS